MLRILTAMFACALVTAATPTIAATAIGRVSRIQGDAMGVVEGGARALAAADQVYLDETITTGVDARLEVALDDRTLLTVGEKATLRLDAFVYRPDASVVRVAVTGAFRFISGAVPPAATRDAAVTTPFAVIAVRGTDLWGGPIDGAFGVFLFEGLVAVTNAGATVNLTAPGQGTNLATAGVPPAPVTVWADDKVARAVATVTFR